MAMTQIALPTPDGDARLPPGGAGPGCGGAAHDLLSFPKVRVR